MSTKLDKIAPRTEFYELSKAVPCYMDWKKSLIVSRQLDINMRLSEHNSDGIHNIEDIFSKIFN